MIDARGHRVSVAGRAAEPYLSVVVTTRNDDHGHNPLGRFQAFVNCLVAQCRRANLPAELIVVEWNPPADRPALQDALTWPLADSPCTVRIVQVPAELHRTLKHPDALPLYQMIAKNVGIRRAHGQFVLSTNIDILLENELVDYIAGRNLSPGVMYRVDRHDVEADVPVEVPLQAMLSYCRAHQLRKHTRWGSFPVDSDGAYALFSPDIVADDAGVRFGEGWHACEGAGEEKYRWASACAEISVDYATHVRLLNIEAESNPFEPESRVELSVSDAAGNVLLASTALSGRGVLQVVVPPGGTRRVCLEGRTARDNSETLPIYEDRDQLIYRVLRIWWDTEKPSAVSDQWGSSYPRDCWRAAEGSGTQVEPAAGGLSIVTGSRRLSYAAEYGPIVAPAAGTYRFRISMSIAEGGVSVQALSGDRSRFLPSALHSFLIGSGVRVVSLAVELDANQAFSIIVSNFHPRDGERSRLILRELRGSHRPEECIRKAAAASASPAFAPVAALAPATMAATRRLKRRILDRLRGTQNAPVSLQRETVEQVATTPPGYAQLVEEHRRLAPLEPLRALVTAVRPDRLHTNACGDFQLLSRDDWFELRGFAEFELYSMNIDSLFCHTARYAGLREHVFHAPSCVYHIEHEIGSGWTPEGETKLRTRIAERGVGWLDNGVVSLLASIMKWVNRPMIFNGSDWGFRKHEFPEIVISCDQVENQL